MVDLFDSIKRMRFNSVCFKKNPHYVLWCVTVNCIQCVTNTHTHTHTHTHTQATVKAHASASMAAVIHVFIVIVIAVLIVISKRATVAMRPGCVFIILSNSTDILEKVPCFGKEGNCSRQLYELFFVVVHIRQPASSQKKKTKQNQNKQTNKQTNQSASRVGKSGHRHYVKHVAWSMKFYGPGQERQSGCSRVGNPDHLYVLAKEGRTVNVVYPKSLQ